MKYHAKFDKHGHSIRSVAKDHISWDSFSRWVKEAENEATAKPNPTAPLEPPPGAARPREKAP